MPHSIRLDSNPPRFIKRGTRVQHRSQLSTPSRWPLGQLRDLAPRVLASHDGERPSVDLGYARPVGELIPVLAANDGEVSFALEGTHGSAVSLDHGGSWCTHYTGLSELVVIRCFPRHKRRQLVRGGEVIGYTTGKLGFELWQWTDDRGFVAIDARPHLATWNHALVATSATNKKAA